MVTYVASTPLSKVDFGCPYTFPVLSTGVNCFYICHAALLLKLHRGIVVGVCCIAVAFTTLPTSVLHVCMVGRFFSMASRFTLKKLECLE